MSLLPGRDRVHRPYTAAMTDPSIDERVDLAERNHLSSSAEAQFVEYTYAAAFRFFGKGRGEKSEAEILEELVRACQGSIRVALMARRRASETWSLNPSDQEAAEAHRLLTLLAASFIPEYSRAAKLNFA